MSPVFWKFKPRSPDFKVHAKIPAAANKSECLLIRPLHSHVPCPWTMTLGGEGVRPIARQVWWVFVYLSPVRLETLIELTFLKSICSSLFILFEVDNRFSIERFEPTVSQLYYTILCYIILYYIIVVRCSILYYIVVKSSQSTVSLPPLKVGAVRRAQKNDCQTSRLQSRTLSKRLPKAKTKTS